MKEVFDQMEAEVDQRAVDKKFDEIERKNLLLENENLIAECLSKDVFYTATNYVLTVSRLSRMFDAYTAAQKRIVILEAKNSSLKHKIQNDDHDEIIKHFSKLGVEHLNLQLKYQHLKERFGNKKSATSLDAPAFDLVFVIGRLEERLQGKNEKVKQNYKELYDSIKLTLAKTIEKTTSLLDEINNLKAQIKNKIKCVTVTAEKPKVLAPGMYAIDVEPILPRNRNNREVHLDYFKHLKESVATIREIIKEVRVEKPLDSSLASACRVKGTTTTSESKPRSKTKKDRTLPAKSDMKKVEDHPRSNKSSVKQKDRVDSSISYKRTVINSNSNFACKTCNKCLMSFNHDKRGVKLLKFVKKPLVHKVWRVKQIKQVWQPTGKLFATVDHQWKPNGRTFTLGEQCPLTS
nr:hypothetical protein [Tanacetum cinerariifolium]